MKLIKTIENIESKNRIFERFFAENPEIRENYKYWLEKKKSLKKKAGNL